MSKGARHETPTASGVNDAENGVGRDGRRVVDNSNVAQTRTSVSRMPTMPKRRGVEDVDGVTGIDDVDVVAGVNDVGRVLGGTMSGWAIRMYVTD